MSDKITIDGQEYNLNDFNTGPQQASKILNDSMPAGKLSVYYEEDGKLLRAKFDLREDIQIVHSEAISRIYVEILTESGTPKYIFIGSITNKIDPIYTENIVLREEFTVNGVARQIWINKDVNDRVTIYMPNKDIKIGKSSTKDNPPVKSGEEPLNNNFEKTEYGYRRINKRFDV